MTILDYCISLNSVQKFLVVLGVVDMSVQNFLVSIKTQKRLVNSMSDFWKRYELNRKEPNYHVFSNPSRLD